MEKNIVIMGNGQLAKILGEFPGVLGYVSYLDMENVYNIYTDKKICPVNKEKHLGVVATVKFEHKMENCRVWLKKGYKLGKLIHPLAYVSKKAQIGEGSVIMPFAFIDPASKIGKCSIVGSYSAVRCAVIGNYVHLPIGITVLPYAEIGDCVFIGSGSVILENMKIGKGCIIGANSTITKDIPSYYKYIERIKEILLEKIDKSFLITAEELSKKKHSSY